MHGGGVDVYEATHAIAVTIFDGERHLEQLSVCLQVPRAVGAAQCAHALRKMHEHLVTKQLSERQLEIARELAESLVASLEEVHVFETSPPVLSS